MDQFTSAKFSYATFKSANNGEGAEGQTIMNGLVMLLEQKKTEPIKSNN